MESGFTKALRRWTRHAATAAALFVLALLLRSCGLSHGLYEGEDYHPDTSKQVRAADQFLSGRYLVKFDHSDYDGYPLFHSHLLEYGMRLAGWARAAALTHAGIDAPPWSPAFGTLYWSMRVMNALLSALSATLLFLVLRRHLHPVAALTGGLLAALAPLDVTFSHYASGDAAAGFFVMLTLLLATRMGPGSSAWWYALAGLSAAAGFSSKYHAGLALAAVLMAHLTSPGGWRAWFTGRSIRCLAALGLSFLAGVFLTSPTLLVNSGQAWQDMRNFFAYTADFGLSAHERTLGLPARMILSVQRNLPVIVDWAGPALLLAVAGLGAWRSQLARPAAWMLVLYLLAIAGKPNLHTSHHTVLAPALLLLAAVAMDRALTRPRLRIAAALVALAALGYAARYTQRELFFYRWSDARWIAETWAKDNLPDGSRVQLARYTWSTTPTPPREDGLAFRATSDRRAKPSAAETEIACFAPEPRGLSIFRNRPVRIFGEAARVSPADFQFPWFSPQPASRPDRLILTDMPWLFRTPRCVDLGIRGTWQKAVGFREPRPEAWLWIQTGPDPLEFSMRIGGQRMRISVPPGTCMVRPLGQLKTQSISRSPYRFARWETETRQGAGRIMLLTSTREAAWASWFSGDNEDALALWARASATNAWDAWAMAVAQAQVGRTAQHPAVEPGPALDWWRDVPYLTYSARELGNGPALREADGRSSTWELPRLWLSPGSYRVQSQGDAAANATWTPPCGTATTMVFPEALNWPLSVPLQQAGSVFALHYAQPTPPPAAVTLRPDAARMAEHLKAWVADPPHVPAATPPALQLDAVFENGLILHGVTLTDDSLRPGEDLLLHLQWILPKQPPRLSRLKVWIHVRDDAGNLVFQGDHRLNDSLRSGMAGSTGCPIRMPAPADLRSGRYTLTAGLWDPESRLRQRVKEASVPHQRRAVPLGTIQVDGQP